MDDFSLHFLPKELRKTLKPFQKEGIRYGIGKNGRCLIGDEMGLGKTLQALSIAYYYKADWPMLVIVPSSLKYTWVDEIEKWLPEIPPEDINLIKGSSDFTALHTARINIISYGLISLRSNLNTALLKGIKDAEIGVTIIDESHFIKNRQATRTKKIFELLKGMKRVVLLTGTPSLARPEELFSQINVIRPGLVGNWQYFGERYCEGHFNLQTGRGGKVFRTFDTRGASNLKELHEVLKKNVMIRRLKQDVLTELPAKRRQRVSFDIGQNSDRKRVLDDSLKTFKSVVTKYKRQFSEFKDEKLVTLNDVSTAMTVLFRDTGLAKAGAIQEYISDLLDGMQNKFIVFCYHLNVIAAVTEILAKRSTRYVRIAGDVPSDIRANYVKEFQNNPKCRVAVLSITASCMGITLTAADHVVFAELHWTPGVIKQAEDRCHRIGQKSSVQIHFLTARGTLDDIMWSMLSRKLTVTSETLDGETQSLSADSGNQGLEDLLSSCDAWMPDDSDDDVDLFTPMSKKREQNDNRDIRTFFSPSSTSNEKGKKRKVRDYYEKGFLNASNGKETEFKSMHKRSQKMRNSSKINEKTQHSGSVDSIQVIIDSDDDIFYCERDKKCGIPVTSHIMHSNTADAKSEIEFDTEINGAESMCEEKINDAGKAKTESRNRIDMEMLNIVEETDANNLLRFKDEEKTYSMNNESEYVVNETELDEGSTEDALSSAVNSAPPMSYRPSADIMFSSDFCKEPRLCSSSVSESFLSNSEFRESAKDTPFSCHSKTFECDSVSKSTQPTPECLHLSSSSECTEDESLTWRCVDCSFDNHEDIMACKICHGARQKTMAKAATTSRTGKRNVTESKLDPIERNDRKTKEIMNDVGSNEFSEAENTARLRIDSLLSPLAQSFSDTSPWSSNEMHPSVLKSTDDLRKELPDANFPDENVSKSAVIGEVTEFISESDSDSSTDIEEDWAIDTRDMKAKFEGRESNCVVGSGNSPCCPDSSRFMDKTCGILSVVNATCKTSSDFCIASKKGNNKGYSFSSRSLGLPTSRTSSDEIAVIDSQSLLNPNTKEGKIGLNRSREIVSQIFNERELNHFSITRLHEDLKLKSLDWGVVQGANEKSEIDISQLGSTSVQAQLLKRSSDFIAANSSTSTTADQAAGHGNVEKKKPAMSSDSFLDCSDVAIHDILDDDISMIGSGKSESEGEEKEEVLPVELQFKMSFESDRVYLYNKEGLPLSINLRMPDVQLVTENDLPKIFSHPYNLKQLKRFFREWKMLTSTKQRQLRKAGLVFKSPLQAYDELKSRFAGSSKERFRSKVKSNEQVKTVAEMIRGTITEIKTIKKQRRCKNQNAPDSENSSQWSDSTESDTQRQLQAVDPEGCPICLFCNAKVQNGFRAGLSEARFCSYNCKEEYMFRTSSSRVVRERLFATEKGICQICSFDAHALFAKIAALRRRDRRKFIEGTHFTNLPALVLNRMIIDPKEGQFWEADHVKAVSEGGGECGLENYRTLCVPCHRQVTKDLHKRLSHEKRRARASAHGNHQLEAFFKPSKPTTTERTTKE